MFLTSLLLIVGFVVLIKGADFLVKGATSLAKRFNVSNMVIGLTVVAFGTSMPELVVSLIAALNGQNDASFGNIIGSNNFNLLFVLGISGTIYPLVVQKNTVKYEVPLSVFAAIILYILVNDRLLWQHDSNLLSRTDSILLLVLFAGFMLYISKTISNPNDNEQGTKVKIHGTYATLGMIAFGLVMLIGGGKLVVNNAVSIAKYFDLSEKLIGLTILAVGTSLPELATSAVAAYRKNADIAIGNVVGSNIFNILFILGITGLVNPIPYNAVMNLDLHILLISTAVLMLFMFTLHHSKLDRWEALIFLTGYLVYTTYLILLD